LLGAWAAKNVTEYLGMDPNTETHNNAHKLINFLTNYYPNLNKTDVLCIGSQEFTKEAYPQYYKYFDLAFTSPPYFDTEVYSHEDTQSCNMFRTYDAWVKEFFRPTIHNTIDALKDDGIFSINIFEKLPNMKKIIVFIAEEKGFQLFKQDKMLLRTMPGKQGTDKETGESIARDTTIGGNYEPIFYFRHKDVLKELGIKGYGVKDFQEITVDRDVRKLSVPLSNGKRLKGDTH
jgi:hypothetical protein